MFMIAILDIVAAIGLIVALFFIPQIPSNRIGHSAKLFLILSTFLYLFISISNILEHLNITSELDDWEGPADALFFPFVLFFFYAVWLWQENQRRLKAERHLNELNTVLQSAQQVNKLLNEQTKSIEEDFSRAAEIMQTLLPMYAPVISGTSVCAIHRPSHQVGGDLYDIVQIDSHNVAIFVADATGHGVAAALLAMLFKNQLRIGEDGKTKLLNPGEYLEFVNKKLYQSCLGTGMFVTAVCGVLDIQSNILKIVSAGHPPAMLQRNNSQENVQLITSCGPALGLVLNVKYPEVTIQLNTGDRLLMYTDGVYCQNGAGEISPVDRIAKLFSKFDVHGIRLLYKISAEMHCENELSDDVTMLLLELAPGLSQMENFLQTTQTSQKLSIEKEQCLIMVGASENGIFIQLQGRVIWTCAVSFNEVCLNAINEAKVNGVTLYLDFKNCVHLDSTILGTIHELVAKTQTDNVVLYLQNLSPRISALFEELGMNSVIAHVRRDPEQLPGRMTMQEIITDTKLSPERVLRAHEALSEVNEHNQKQFGLLVKSLRKEIGGSSSQK